MDNAGNTQLALTFLHYRLWERGLLTLLTCGSALALMWLLRKQSFHIIAGDADNKFKASIVAATPVLLLAGIIGYAYVDFSNPVEFSSAYKTPSGETQTATVRGYGATVNGTSRKFESLAQKFDVLSQSLSGPPGVVVREAQNDLRLAMRWECLEELHVTLNIPYGKSPEEFRQEIQRPQNDSVETACKEPSTS